MQGRIKQNREGGFTWLNNEPVKRKDMSLRAKGLLLVMFSLPDGWDYSIAGLAAISKESEGTIKKTLDELKDYGYLKVIKLNPDETDSGRIEYIYEIYDQSYRKQGIEKQGVEKQPIEKQSLVFCDNIIKDNKLKTNKRKSNQLKINKYIAEIIENVENEKLKECLSAFAEMRSMQKKPLTERSLQMIINRLNKISIDIADQCEMLNQSTINGWLNVYPLKKENSKTANPFLKYTE